jgi:rubrerythrin
MTIVVTKATGGTARALESTYVAPESQMAVVASGSFADAGMNAGFVMDLLSACVAHERCGAHLYQSVAGRTIDADLRASYEQFGAETREHVDKLERLIVEAGGDPNYVSPSARATERTAGGILESTFLLSGSVDAATAEVVMLEAVMLAEAKDHSNWELLAQLAVGMADGPLSELMLSTTEEVLAQEEEHYGWARETRARLLFESATGGMAGDGAMSGPNGAGGDRTRDELYAEAQEMDIPGRSQMTKDELEAAVNDQAVNDQAVNDQAVNDQGGV